jgi:hypothetical protein
MEFIDMVRTIQEGALDVYLIKLKTMVSGIGK